MLPPISTLLSSIDILPSINVFPIPQIATPVKQQQTVPVLATKRRNVMKFSKQEDNLLRSLVSTYGKNWKVISEIIQTRNPRQCRERWCNYINPTLSNEPWSAHEDLLLTQKYAEYGPHWSKISKFFVNRSDNNVKKRWKELLKRSQSRLDSSSSGLTSDSY